MAAKRKTTSPTDEALLGRLNRIQDLLAELGPEVVGDRLRRLRVLQNQSVRALATRAGVSKNTLIRLEQGRGTQPLTVWKVCSALGVHVDRISESVQGGVQPAAVHYRSDDRWYDVADMGSERLLGVDRALRPSERKRAVERGAHTPINLLQSRLAGGRVLPSVLEIYQETPRRSHVGEELVYVLSGRVLITVGKAEYRLAEGESVTFWSAEPHSYAPADRSRLPARVLSVRLEG